MMQNVKKARKFLTGMNNGHLIIDATDAKIPGCLSLDVRALPFAYFHTRPSEEGTVLGYDNDKGAFVALAVFTEQATADRILAQIRRDMMARSTLLRLVKKVVIAGVAFFLLVQIVNVVHWMVVASAPSPYSLAAAGMRPGLAAPVPPAGLPPAAAGGGMPVDADSRLKSPE